MNAERFMSALMSGMMGRMKLMGGSIPAK